MDKGIQKSIEKLERENKEDIDKGLQKLQNRSFTRYEAVLISMGLIDLIKGERTMSDDMLAILSNFIYGGEEE